MTVYILVIFAVIFIIAGLIYAMKEQPKPEPENGQPVLDHFLQKWTYLRPLKNGTFLFRTPQGKIHSLSISEMEKMNFCNQFDFEAVKK